MLNFERHILKEIPNSETEFLSTRDTLLINLATKIHPDLGEFIESLLYDLDADRNHIFDPVKSDFVGRIDRLLGAFQPLAASINDLAEYKQRYTIWFGDEFVRDLFQLILVRPTMNILRSVLNILTAVILTSFVLSVCLAMMVISPIEFFTSLNQQKASQFLFEIFYSLVDAVNSAMHAVIQVLVLSPLSLIKIPLRLINTLVNGLQLIEQNPYLRSVVERSLKKCDKLEKLERPGAGCQSAEIYLRDFDSSPEPEQLAASILKNKLYNPWNKVSMGKNSVDFAKELLQEAITSNRDLTIYYNKKAKLKAAISIYANHLVRVFEDALSQGAKTNIPVVEGSLGRQEIPYDPNNPLAFFNHLREQKIQEPTSSQAPAFVSSL